MAIPWARWSPKSCTRSVEPSGCVRVYGAGLTGAPEYPFLAGAAAAGAAAAGAASVAVERSARPAAAREKAATADSALWGRFLSGFLKDMRAPSPCIDDFVTNPWGAVRANQTGRRCIGPDMKRTLAAGIVLAALSSATALVSADAATSHPPTRAAKAGTYQVTASVNKTEPVIGSKVKIEATVKPVRAGCERSLLQVKYHVKGLEVLEDHRPRTTPRPRQGSPSRTRSAASASAGTAS